MLLNEMDFKLKLFAPKVSSYFSVKLQEKIVNLLNLLKLLNCYFQFEIKKLT